MAVAIEQAIGLDEREQLLLRLLAKRRGVNTLALLHRLITESLEHAEKVEHLTETVEAGEISAGRA